MQLNLSVAEMTEILKEIKNNPERLFEMMRIDVKETIGKYLSELMKVELSDSLGREHYQRKDCGDNTNHRNSYYGKRFTFKRIGEVSLTIPRDRLNEFKTRVLPRSKRYEDDIRNDICLMY